jgi:DNA-binding Lrp family transcriptional regulator
MINLIIKMPTAYVLINTVLGTEEEVLKDLRKIETVKDAYIVMGEFDVVATLCASTIRELKDTIKNRIRYQENIMSTQTLLAVGT